MWANLLCSSPEKKGVASRTDSIYAEKVAAKSSPEAIELPKVTKLYKSQGISWSNDPARRIAVINSSVVHEGESVANGIVVKIEKDFVVIRTGNNKYNVQF